MIFVANAFSLNMLSASPHRLDIAPVDDISDFLAIAQDDGEEIASIVGHADTARVFSSVLGFPIKENRVTFTLSKGVTLLVGQYSGPRLSEGATTLPEGAQIMWWSVRF